MGNVMGFYSSHMWANGAILTVERVSDKEVSIRVQDDKEQMLADFNMGEYEAICLIHAITSVLTKSDDDIYQQSALIKGRS